MRVNSNDIRLNQIANKNLIKIVFITTIIVIISIWGEMLKGGRSITEWFLNSGILIITTITVTIMYKKDKENKFIRYIVFIGYVSVWLYTYLTSDRSIVFAFGFPFISAFVLYGSKKDMIVVTPIVIGLVSTRPILEYARGNLYGDAISEYGLCIAVTLIFSYAMYSSASVLNMFKKSNQNFIHDIIDNKEKQDRIIEEVKKLNEKVDKNTGDVLNIVDIITEESNVLQESLVQISNGSKKNSEVIQIQVESSQTIQNKLKSAAELTKEMNSLSENTGKVIKESNGIVCELKEQSEMVNNTNDEVKEMMKALQEGSKNIVAVTETIDNIVKQTTLLALNASIEAARAGESGRGFSVVADEIRKLAEQSGQSIENVISITNDIQSKLMTCVSTVDRLTEANSKQSDLVTRTTDIFKDIDDNTKTIILKVSNVNEEVNKLLDSNETIVRGINDISSVAEETMAMTEECSNIAIKFREISKDAFNLTNELKLTTESINKIY